MKKFNYYSVRFNLVLNIILIPWWILVINYGQEWSRGLAIGMLIVAVVCVGIFIATIVAENLD